MWPMARHDAHSQPVHRFIEGLALAQLPLGGAQAAELLEFLQQQLAHSSDAVCSRWHACAHSAIHTLDGPSLPDCMSQ